MSERVRKKGREEGSKQARMQGRQRASERARKQASIYLPMKNIYNEELKQNI